MNFSNSKVLASLDDINNRSFVTQVSLILLSMTVLVMSLNLIFEDRETVVAPPDYSEELIISGNKANKHYKLMWGYAIASWVGNITSRNADVVVEMVERMFSPYLQQHFLPVLKNDAIIIKARDAESTFRIEGGEYEPLNDVVFIWGKRKLKIPGSGGKEPEQRWTYEYRIGTLSGRPVISYYDAYQGLPKIKQSDYKADYLPIYPAEMKKAMASTNPAKFTENAIQSAKHDPSVITVGAKDE